MDNGGYNLLLRFIDSAHFSLFLCISYLARYTDNVGIHHYLCQKLRSYPYPEIEFFLPQLCQIILTVPTESVALEDFLLDMCNRSTHSAVLTFWLLQAHLEDLSHDPEARSFQICRRLYNRTQYILFGIGDPPSHKIHQNPVPAMMLSGAIMGAIACPLLTKFTGPVTIAQARKPRFRVFHLAAANGKAGNPKNGKTEQAVKDKKLKKTAKFDPVITRIETDNVRHNIEVEAADVDEDEDDNDSNDNGEDIYTVNTENGESARSSRSSRSSGNRSLTNGAFYGLDSAGISSLPDLRSHNMSGRQLTASLSSASIFTQGSYRQVNRPLHVHPVQPATLTQSTKVRMLKSNYFRYETSFAYALQAISTRLRLVPKPARVSALRAEIALLNNEFPAEVDIPMILETDTYKSNPRQHKIARISPAEATILNSAERVPFLLMIEVLRDEIDFDPSTSRNTEILTNPTDYRTLFDLAYPPHPPHLQLGVAANEEAKARQRQLNNNDLAESEMGDISASHLTDVGNDIGELPSDDSEKANGSARTSSLSFSSAYYVNRQPEIVSKHVAEMNDAAVHMRTAATMLAQLDYAQSVDGQRKLEVPKNEIIQIKNKIITSMQLLEEQSVFSDVEIGPAPPSPTLKSSGGPASKLKKEAGQRRLENDLKTGVIKTDRSLGFGEEWNEKRERIRKNSPFGHLPNWDLVSVIAKTGSDLRQEAFACQIILAMKRIWEEADLNVWVRRMTILVTGPGSGLVETITNGVSIHSLKKALATLLLGPSETPHKGRVTLSEYFFRAFGVRGSEKFKQAQAEFIKSLTGYSLICYLLQIKDRHNGNILLDTSGHVIHIDFGFLLSNSPGSVGFEAAPFKLTQEYVDLMDGPNSEAFESFRALMKLAFKAIRKHADEVVLLVEMMQKESPLPCFMHGDQTAHLLRQRFQLQLSESEVDAFVDNFLINKSMNSMYTRLYDQYQLVTQGIYA
ncbi:kinase-like domain-containing protein [Lipomyces japonicus]|uniref:kinase-like domain-containing protein n=1 Tax=Lipomyces japonicus TaxID=56871 RepID=UPI0034CD5609